MNSSDKNDWKKLPLMLEVVEKTCYWHDDVKCPDHCDCEICGHQPPDDEKENGEIPVLFYNSMVICGSIQLSCFASCT